MPHVTRRNALALAAAGSFSAACSIGESASVRRVAVIGAGIVGASIAYHLVKAGAQVTVLERHEIATRASRGTFAWLNATWAKQPRHYHRLNQLGLAGWQELEREIDIPIKWGGSIEWFADAVRQRRLAEQIEEQAEWGEPARMLDRQELAELEPKVEFGAAQTAALSSNDGALDPVLATRILLQEAERLGAEVHTNCTVSGVQPLSKGVVLATSKGEFETDIYVLATGADPDAIRVLAGIDVPQRSTPGVIVVTKPAPQQLNRIVVAPGVHIHQRLDGRMVLGEQDGPPDTAAHADRLQGRPNRFPTSDLADQHAQRILALARDYLPEIAKAEVEDVFIGWRPLPLDGHPAVGFSPTKPEAYIAIAHSGVSLAPIIGKLAAGEILDDAKADLLAPYRPDRDFEDVRRY